VSSVPSFGRQKAAASRDVRWLCPMCHGAHHRDRLPQEFLSQIEEER